MAAHDLGHRDAADIIHRGIPDDFLQDGGDVLGGRAVAGGVIGETQVIVDGFGNADEPDAAAHPLAIAAELGDGVHRVVAANVEDSGDVVLVKEGKQLRKGHTVLIGVGQLIAAAAQEAGGGPLQQLNAHPVIQHDVQIHDFFFQQALNAVLHAVNLAGPEAPGGLVDTGKAGIDDGGGAAGLADDHILAHN